MVKAAYYLIIDIVVKNVIHINKNGSVNLRLIHLSQMKLNFRYN
jgi:hypothetical protein